MVTSISSAINSAGRKASNGADAEERTSLIASASDGSARTPFFGPSFLDLALALRSQIMMPIKVPLA